MESDPRFLLRQATSTNRALLRAGAKLFEVWVPAPSSPLIVEVFCPKTPAGPPSFEGVIFQEGQPVQAFRASHDLALFNRITAEYPALKDARRMSQRTRPARLNRDSPGGN